MDTHKLRVKIGAHEFEAEGSKDSVNAQFEAWKQLIASVPPQSPEPLKPRLPPTVTEVKTRDGHFAAPWDIFDGDDKRKLVTLRVHPIGETRDADAALLILYGYRKSMADQPEGKEVPVTRLKEAMAVSGLRPERIDRALGPHVRAGYIMKAGRGKGGKYRLTNTGYARADEMARALFEKLEVT